MGRKLLALFAVVAGVVAAALVAFRLSGQAPESVDSPPGHGDQAPIQEEQEYFLIPCPLRAVGLDGRVHELTQGGWYRPYWMCISARGRLGLVEQKSGTVRSVDLSLDRRVSREDLREVCRIRAARDWDYEFAVHPVWSPDEASMAFAGHTPAGDDHLCVVDLQTGALKVLATYEYSEPIRGEGQDVWVLDRPHDNEEPAMSLGRISWSPDSTMLAVYVHFEYFVSPQEDWLGVRVYDLSGKEVMAAGNCWNAHVEQDDGFGDPFWSPDGRTIYFRGNFHSDEQKEVQARLKNPHFSPQVPYIPPPPPWCYSLTLGEDSPQKLCAGTPSSLTPDGRILYLLQPRAPKRLHVKTGRLEDLGDGWYKPRTSLSGRFVAARGSGGLFIYDSTGKRVAEVPGETGGNWNYARWVYLKPPRDEEK